MGKWTWALLFLGSIAVALYFLKYKKPTSDIVVPAQTPAQQGATTPLIPDEAPPPTGGGEATNPLSGEMKPLQPNVAPTQPAIPIQTPPSNFFEPPQYEPPPPPPPPPQYPEPVEPFNANPPPNFEQPPDGGFPEDAPPPPPPQAFPEEEFD